MTVAPENLAELADAVRAHSRVLAVGGQTKPRLSQVDPAVTLLSTRRLSGIVEYEPDEFTFTALAGTPVREIADALARRGQYLPFDPMLLDAGATLGGTVAAGLSGPGRFRFGGVRDFILGVRFVDGTGRLLRMGGKVVKNAAGFDLPKFFVGSLGRFGVLGEITFKVFPRALATRTLQIDVKDSHEATRILTDAASSRWEPDALDLPPDRRCVLLRLAACDELAREILSRWPGCVLGEDEACEQWSSLREFRWAPPGSTVVKVALTPAQVPALLDSHVQIHISAGGNMAFVASPEASKLDELGLRGLTLRGEGPLWCGVRPRFAVEAAVREALDPQQRFPSLDDE